MRIFGLGGRVMSKLGATTVLVPGGDLMAAFDKGQIDAAELYTPVIDEQEGLQAKVKLIYVPGWHQPETVLELLVNKDRWNGLNVEQRSLIEDACHDMLRATLVDSTQLQSDALARLAAKAGVRIKPWPDDVLAAFKDAWGEVAKEESDRDYFFRIVLDDIDKFRAKAAGGETQAQPASQASAP